MENLIKNALRKGWLPSKPFKSMDAVDIFLGNAIYDPSFWKAVGLNGSEFHRIRFEYGEFHAIRWMDDELRNEKE